MTMKNKNVIAVQNIIRNLEIKSLKNHEVIANLIRAFGLVQWGPSVFGKDELFKNPSVEMVGIYQVPSQLAKALVYLSEFKINSYCEIGIFQGGSFLFISEYLRRFNPEIQCTGIDPTNYLNDEIRAIIDMEEFLCFRSITSDQMAGQRFDLVFIDGDHTAKWVAKDWENLGRRAKICIVHDIQEVSCPDIIAFWKKIKNRDSVEFLDYTSAIPLQGIGIIHNREFKANYETDPSRDAVHAAPSQR